ncbi:SUF system Fe-S cluster assembly protein [Rhodospirillum rubrum]|uniref:SUF system Fe-S cluster assembly protein n=1 Tax=Rhodospirillum rubrum TaxID=1085 RepID=UPI001904442E|nr:SUF system Fe-S cluster assembly protein [Rhodospirillum rubrum]MBK1665760.1 SUF system Fe-S cluster assembly protein [Rhodospirillum rubrum]MBK1677843.1 SUF system Fe-S cluster assembly protein [Rhodospirillum rubrum]
MMPPYAMPAALMDPPEEGAIAHAGSPLVEGATPASRDAVIDSLQEIYDPEIPVNIYDLGLIYEIEIDDHGDCKILMTLTAPACPVAGTLPGETAEKVATLEGIGRVEVNLTWEPPWTPERMSEVARVALDMF